MGSAGDTGTLVITSPNQSIISSWKMSISSSKKFSRDHIELTHSGRIVSVAILQTLKSTNIPSAMHNVITIHQADVSLSLHENKILNEMHRCEPQGKAAPSPDIAA